MATVLFMLVAVVAAMAGGWYAADLVDGPIPRTPPPAAPAPGG